MTKETKKTMQRILLITLLICSGLADAAAQKKFQGIERGGALGAVHYLGDLNPQAKLNRPNYYIGALFKYNFSDYISLGAQADIGKVSYADSLNSSAYESIRNLNFQSNIADAHIFSEFNFFRFRTGDFKYRWTPYLSAGVGAMYYSPVTYYDGTRYSLNGIGTEGQNTSAYSDRKYQNLAFIIPVGFGIKYWIRPGFNMALEINQKFTYTDYLDDVSSTYVGPDKFIFNNRKDVSYYIQDRSIEVLDEPIGVEGRQRGTSTDRDRYIGFQIKLTYIPQKYVCPSQ